jgi:hypothetical protein
MNRQPVVEAARLEIRQGRPRVEPLYDGNCPSAELPDDWGCLYAISQAMDGDPSGDRLLERVEGVAQETYRRSPGGITNRLRLAARNANKYLYLRNCVRGPDHAVLASLACVAVRGCDAYACGVGPHSVLVVSGGRVRGPGNLVSSIGEESADEWQSDGHLLGRSAQLADPRFSYRQLMPGDQVLVVAGDHGGWFSRAGDHLRGLLGEQDIVAAAERLGRQIGEQMDGVALLLRLQNGHEAPPLPQRNVQKRIAGDRSSLRPMLSSLLTRGKKPESLERRGGDVEQAVQLGAAQPDRGERIARRPTRPWRAVGHDAGHVPVAQGAEPGSANLFVSGVERCRLGGALLLSLLLFLRGAALGLLRRLAEWTTSLWGWIRRHRLLEHTAGGARLALSATWAGLKGLVVGILPERQRSGRTYAATARPMARARVLGFHPSGRSRVVIGVLIVVVVFLLLGLSAVRVRARLQQADVERLVDDVSGQLAVADLQDDRESTMAALEQAETILSGATDSQRRTPELIELSEELEARWDGLIGAIRLSLSTELAAEVPGQAAGGVLVHGEHLYVLDEAGRRLSRYTLDEEGHLLSDQEPWTWELPESLMGSADTKILDMAWADAASGRVAPALLVLTSDAAVVEVRMDGSARAVEVADLAAWQKPQALETYSGNLYVLDPGHGNIYKYVPSGDDYQQAPMDYIQASVDLDWSRVVDMAIDGYVYLLMSNGKIEKFAGGQPEPFPQGDLYPPLSSPVRIYAQPEYPSVLVAEAAEGRIVEFTREGQFVRQYRGALDGSNDLAELRAFTVDIGHSRLVVAGASGLSSGSLPALREQGE